VSSQEAKQLSLYLKFGVTQVWQVSGPVQCWQRASQAAQVSTSPEVGAGRGYVPKLGQEARHTVWRTAGKFPLEALPNGSVVG
jgi:hypothetical protein